MAELSLNLAQLHPDVRQSLIKGLVHEDRARHALGVIEQLRLKKMMDAAAQPGFNREIGRTSMVISTGQYQAAQQQYGELCFADPDFGKFLLKKHDDFRVKDVGTRIQSGWTPASEGRGGATRTKEEGGKRG